MVTVRSSGGQLRVVVVDDHELLRAGTRRILEACDDFVVVGEAGDAETARAVVASTQPDLALLDIRLPGTNGLELARSLLGDHPDTQVVILSAYDDESYVRAALAAGVAGYFLKTTPSNELVHGLRTLSRGVATGQVWPDLVDGGEMAELTPRELAVVAEVARGLTNKAIARELQISPRTVEGHLNHVFEKIGARSRTELVNFALVSGILQPREAGASG